MTDPRFEIWYSAYKGNYGGTKLMEGRHLAEQAWLASQNASEQATDALQAKLDSAEREVARWRWVPEILAGQKFDNPVRAKEFFEDELVRYRREIESLKAHRPDTPPSIERDECGVETQDSWARRRSDTSRLAKLQKAYDQHRTCLKCETCRLTDMEMRGTACGYPKCQAAGECSGHAEVQTEKYSKL